MADYKLNPRCSDSKSNVFSMIAYPLQQWKYKVHVSGSKLPIGAT